MKLRCTVVTSPWPRQVLQVTGLEPGSPPDPWHLGHTTAVSILTDFVHPKTASWSFKPALTSAFWPCWTRDRGPRPAVCPPNMASMMVEKSNPPNPAPPKPPAPPVPLRPSGSPP